MSLLSEIIKDLKETAVSGTTNSGNIAVNTSNSASNDMMTKNHGFKRGGQPLGTEPWKKRKKRKIPLYIKEDEHENDVDTANVMSKLKTAEKYAKSNKDSVGFALETDDDKIIKVYVDKDQSDEFEDALSKELRKNEEPENSHREIGEILFDLKDDFDITNIIWPDVRGDSKEEQEVEIGDEEPDKEPDKEPDEEDEVEPEPESKVDDEESVKSALDSVIAMMKADAEARRAEAEAKEAEAKAKESETSLQQAKVKLGQEEDILDMEAYNKRKKEEKEETERLAKLAKYKHELDQDKTTGEVDDQNLVGDESEELNYDYDNKSIDDPEKINFHLSRALQLLMKSKQN